MQSAILKIHVLHKLYLTRTERSVGISVSSIFHVLTPSRSGIMLICFCFFFCEFLG